MSLEVKFVSEWRMKGLIKSRAEVGSGLSVAGNVSDRPLWLPVISTSRQTSQATVPIEIAIRRTRNAPTRTEIMFDRDSRAVLLLCGDLVGQFL